MTNKTADQRDPSTNILPDQFPTNDELMYARLDGKHAAQMEDEKRALDFLYAYTMMLAPNKKVAETFRAAYAMEKLGLNRGEM